MKEKQVINDVSKSSLIAVSVGQNALEKVIPIIAKALLKRFSIDPTMPLDIIIAENMRSGNEFIYEKLSKFLPESYPIDRLVGVVETSIGKMVPTMLRGILKMIHLLCLQNLITNLSWIKMDSKVKSLML
jgi:mannitol-1-phosphate 5-dehydrogenase